MKKVIATLLLFLVAGMKISAQEIELPMYVNHMADNPFMVSPSYAGIGSELQFRLNGVSQWLGVKGAPDTQSLTVESRLRERLGGGITIFNDKNGFTKQMGAKAAMAYHLTLSDFHDSFFSFALGASYTQFSVNTDEYVAQDTESLPNLSFGTVNFDLSMLYRYERFAISFNATNLLSKEVRTTENDEPDVLRKYSFYPVYTFRVNHNYEFEPSVFLEYFEGSSRSRTDLNAKLRRKIRDGYVWGGVSYTFLNDQIFTPNAIAPLVGMKKKSLYLSYGISFTLNEIMNYNYGTHMVTIGFDFNKRPSLARCTTNMGMF